MLLVTGQERGGTALFANGIGLRRPIEHDPEWSWQLVPGVVAGDQQSARTAVRAAQTVPALKCPSWIFVANSLGRSRFEAIIFLQRDIRDQVASLVEMMAGTTDVDWERPESVWRGPHGEWVLRMAPLLGIDPGRPVEALRDLWCTYARAARGIGCVRYERIAADPSYFGWHLRRVGVSASEDDLVSVLAAHSHGAGQRVRGAGRWQTDLPTEIACRLVKHREATL
jgi:hypothetical protein